MAQPLKYNSDDLFERYYAVRYKHFEARSLESIRRFGVRSSGIPSIDATVENYEVNSELTIDAMFELWRKSVTIKVVNFQDTAEIYEIIQRHIISTAEFLRGAVNGSRKELLKDMVDLDRFASTVYGKAKSIFTEQERAAINKNDFAGMQSINFFNVLNKSYSQIEEVTVTNNGEQRIKKVTSGNRTAPVREREDLSSVFIEQMERLGGMGGINGQQK